MAYKQRPGVVLIDVCGVKLLVAQRSVWEECSTRIQAVGMMGHACWSALEKGFPRETLIRMITSLTRKKRPEAESLLDDYYQKLYEMGFLIEVPDGGEAHDEG